MKLISTISFPALAVQALAVSALALSVSISFFNMGVSAQSLIRSEQVSSLSEQKLIEDNLRYIGGFTYSPKFSIGYKYNNNLYPLEINQGKVDDQITIAKISNELKSNWNRHSLSLYAYLGLDRYSQKTNNSGPEAGVKLATVLDIAEDSRFDFDLGYEEYMQSRSNTSAPLGAVERVSIGALTARTSFSQGFYRFNIVAGGGYSKENYTDVKARGGGIIEQDFRDNAIVDASIDVGYNVSPDLRVYTKVTYDNRKYDPDHISTIDRDSSGLISSLGLKFAVGSLADAYLEIGQENRRFANKLKKDFSGIRFYSSANWTPTPNTLFSGSLVRQRNDSFIAGSDSFMNIALDLKASQHVLTNVYVNGKIRYTKDDYEGIDRDDATLGLGVGFDFHVRKNLSLGFDVDYYDLKSKGVNKIDSYDNIIATFSGKFYF